MSPRRIRNLNMSRDVHGGPCWKSQRFPANINVLHWFTSPFRRVSSRDSGGTGRSEERCERTNWNGPRSGNVSVREISLQRIWNRTEKRRRAHILPSREIDVMKPSENWARDGNLSFSINRVINFVVHPFLSPSPYIDLVDSASVWPWFAARLHSLDPRLTQYYETNLQTDLIIVISVITVKDDTYAETHIFMIIIIDNNLLKISIIIIKLYNNN